MFHVLLALLFHFSSVLTPPSFFTFYAAAWMFVLYVRLREGKIVLSLLCLFVFNGICPSDKATFLFRLRRLLFNSTVISIRCIPSIISGNQHFYSTISLSSIIFVFVFGFCFIFFAVSPDSIAVRLAFISRLSDCAARERAGIVIYISPLRSSIIRLHGGPAVLQISQGDWASIVVFKEVRIYDVRDYEGRFYEIRFVIREDPFRLPSDEKEEKIVATFLWSRLVLFVCLFRPKCFCLLRQFAPAYLPCRAMSRMLYAGLSFRGDRAVSDANQNRRRLRAA